MKHVIGIALFAIAFSASAQDFNFSKEAADTNAQFLSPSVAAHGCYSDGCNTICPIERDGKVYGWTSTALACGISFASVVQQVPAMPESSYAWRVINLPAISNDDLIASTIPVATSGRFMISDPSMRHEMEINFLARAADYSMTFVDLRHGGRELNPVMRPVFGNAHGKNIVYAAAASALQTYILGRIANHYRAHGDPDWRSVLRWNAYVHFGFADWNAIQYVTNRQSASAP